MGLIVAKSVFLAASFLASLLFLELSRNISNAGSKSKMPIWKGGMRYQRSPFMQ